MAAGMGLVPRSGDLMTQPPDWIAVLSTGPGAISRAVHNSTEWRTASAELESGGRAGRIDGYRGHPPNAVEANGSRDARRGDSRALTMRPPPGPITAATHAAALTSSVVATDMVELEHQLGELKRPLAQAK